MTCTRCTHLRRPGRANEFCNGDRQDLPPAYGENHPLRELPQDRGANCKVFELHTAFWKPKEKT